MPALADTQLRCELRAIKQEAVFADRAGTTVGAGSAAGPAQSSGTSAPLVPAMLAWQHIDQERAVHQKWRLQLDPGGAARATALATSDIWM